MNSNRGVLYLLSGTSHAVRLVVSIASLRHVYDGPIAVVTTDDEAAKLAEQMAADATLQIIHRPIDVGRVRKRTEAYLLKTRLYEFSPFESTAYLDCDTLVRGSIDDLFEFPTPEHVIVTQFTDWVTTGRIISKRIRSWNDTHPDLVQPALDFGPAINTGVFAFTRSSTVMTRWHEVASDGRSHFIPDELAMQLIIPHVPHVVLDGRFNCSGLYGNAAGTETRIVHLHGNKHLRCKGGLWLEAFTRVCDRNLGNITQWAPAGDKRLRQHLAAVTS